MDTKGLRIGNLVGVQNNLRPEAVGAIYEVKELDADSVLLGEHHYLENEFGQLSKFVVGIPLTERIVEAFEFTQVGYKKGFIGINVNLKGSVRTQLVLNMPDNESKNFRFDFNHGGVFFSKPFEFVHELQNWFFELTEEDLIYNSLNQTYKWA